MDEPHLSIFAGAGCAFLDVNNDGHLDLYASGGFAPDALYISRDGYLEYSGSLVSGSNFESGGTFLNFKPDAVREHYQAELSAAQEAN